MSDRLGLIQLSLAPFQGDLWETLSTHNGRAKTRLREAYVAAAFLGKRAFQTRARRSLRRRPRRFA